MTAWFERGVEAFAHARPDAPRCYPCPICLDGHVSPQNLSVDHAPSGATGGTRVALTCRNCNSLAGSQAEADMPKLERVYDFVHGTMNEPIQAEIDVQGEPFHISLLATKGDIIVKGIPGANKPATDRAFAEDLERRTVEGTWPDSTIKIRFDVPDSPRKALVGWLRGAYLVVFAAWGYRYILRKPLNVVRQQIRNPDGEILSVFSVTVPESSKSERHISLIDEPAELAGNLIVQMGRHFILLPGMWGNNDIYPILAAEHTGGKECHVTASKEIPWPTNPRYELDMRSTDQ